MNKITAIIPTFNEEVNIEAALESVSFADEILVIDSYSIDNTVDIIEKKYPQVKLMQRLFDDFSNQKNYAIDKASNDWIFLLDADERLTHNLKDEIKSKLVNTFSNDNIGYSFNRDFFFMDKHIKFGGYSNNKVIRLFNRQFCKYNGNLVHEKIIAKGNIGQIKEPIKHYSYKSFSEHLIKVQRYKELQAKELFIKGEKSSIFKILIKPKTRFLSHYFFKLGFLDGFHGFVIAGIQAYGIFIKYVSLRLLNQNKK
ncbi:glycosyltransferase family 2 protein [Polaribacter sp.]|nr:glycosyltransferase family 2 protein [Polaribacter sp.]